MTKFHIEGENVMSKQDNVEISNQQPVIKDLAVNQDQAAEVKGGATLESFHAFPGFTGGIYVAAGDLN